MSGIVMMVIGIIGAVVSMFIMIVWKARLRRSRKELLKRFSKEYDF